MLSEDEVVTGTAYDVLAADYAATFPDLGAEAPSDRALLDVFAARVSTGGTVLDLGCGTGRVAAHLARRGLQLRGLDLSAGMLGQARRRHPWLPVVRGSLHRLPFASGCADGVLAWYSLIHTAPAELPGLVAELARVGRPGTPYLLAFQCGAGERVERSETWGHKVSRVNYRHDVGHVTALLTERGITLDGTEVRDPVAAHETTPQAFVAGARD